MSRIAAFAIACTFLAGCESGDKERQHLASAKAALSKGDPVAATIELKNALDLNPNLAEARVLLASALLKTGNPKQAEIELHKATDAGAPDEQVAPELARALLQAGEAAKVIAQFGQAKLREPQAQTDVLLAVAGAQMMQSNWSAAREAVQAALSLRPGLPDAMMLNARLEAQSGEADKALAQLDSLLSREPNHEGAALQKAELLALQPAGAPAALAWLRITQTMHPTSPGVHAAIINLQIREGRQADAQADFDKLKQLAPRAFETLLLQSQFDCLGGRFKACAETAERLLTAAPADTRLLLLGGLANLRQAQYATAETLLGRALKLNPRLLAARHLLAQVYMGSAAPGKAIEVLLPATEASAVSAASLAQLGEAYLAAGDSARAEAAFQRALKLDPADAGTRTAVALAQLRRGEASALPQLEILAASESSGAADVALVYERVRRKDREGALQALDRLEKKQPEQAYPLVLRARALIQLGDTPAAAASFEKALLKQPGHFPAVAGLADIDFYAGRHDAARKRLQAVVTAQPKNIPARLALVELETRLGATEAQIQAKLTEAVKADAGVPDAHLALINRLLIAGDAQRAQVAAQEATAALPNDHAILDALGRTQIAAGAHTQAVATFKRLAGLQPRSATPLVRMADAQLAAGDRVSAGQSVAKASEVDPGDLSALRMGAVLAAQDKRHAQALDIARSAQRRYPKEGVGFAIEGEVEELAKNWSAAAISYRNALKLTPTSTMAIRLHSSLTAAGQQSEANRMAQDWLKGQPQDVEFMFHQGDLAVQAKQYSGAEARYRAVLNLVPRHVAAMNNLAWLLAQQGKPGAVAMAEQANTLQHDRPALLDTLAFSLEAEKQLPKAVEVQKRAVDLDPRDPQLRFRLAELYVRSGDKSAAAKQLDILSQLGPRFDRQADVAALRSKL